MKKSNPVAARVPAVLSGGAVVVVVVVVGGEGEGAGKREVRLWGRQSDVGGEELVMGVREWM